MPIVNKNQLQKKEKTKIVRAHKIKRGGSLLNKIINNLPFEAHLYDQDKNGKIKRSSYCGPGTNLKKRLVWDKEGNPVGVKNNSLPINNLDKACMYHDIAYHKHKDLKNRNEADRILSDAANKITQDPNSSIINQTNAAFVRTIMNTKSSYNI